MPATVFQSVDEVVKNRLEEDRDTVLVVGPSSQVFEALVKNAFYTDTVPEIRVLGATSIVDDVLADFLAGSRAASLIEMDVFRLRTVESAPASNLFVTDEIVSSIVTTGDSVAELSTDDPEFVTNTDQFYEDTFGNAEPYSLRTPSISRVRQTLEDTFGTAVREDFETVLASVETVGGRDDLFDEVDLILLVAAKHEEQLYEISGWGEDVGLGSQAKFSRAKRDLEEQGLIDTEKISMEIGRPRQRLLISHEKLADADMDNIVSIALEIVTES